MPERLRRPGRPAGRTAGRPAAQPSRLIDLPGHAQIPAFVDTTADRYDQVIENEQREGLRPLELAMFVQKRMTLGESQAEIARKLGKSRQWVTRVTALIDPPDWLLQAYREGRCRGLNELHEIRRLHGLHPRAVEAWVPQQADLTRDRIAELRQSLAVPSSSSEPAPVDGPRVVDLVARGAMAASTPMPLMSPPVHSSPSLPPPPHPTPSDLGVHVDFDGQDCLLVFSMAPVQPGHMYVDPTQGGPRRAAPVEALRLRGFLGR